MPTSGCPVLEPLRPMARFHLPFATGEETVYRTASMYLIAQHLRRRAGLDAEDGIEGLAAIYLEVRKANSFFAKRLRGVVQQDANVNALINLDNFAIMGLDAEAVLDEFTPFSGPTSTADAFMRKLDGYPAAWPAARRIQGLPAGPLPRWRRVLTTFPLPITWSASRRDARRRPLHPSRRGHDLGGDRNDRALPRHRGDDRALPLPRGAGGGDPRLGGAGEDRKRYLVCKGEVHDAEGKLLAKAEGKFFPSPPRNNGRWRSAGGGRPRPSRPGPPRINRRPAGAAARDRLSAEHPRHRR